MNNTLGQPNNITGLGGLAGNRIILRRLRVVDVTQRYVDWLNDPEVNRFLSVKDKHQDMDMVKKYVLSYEGENNKLLLGIFDNKNNLHIGNITFSSINQDHGVGVIGIAIGEKDCWGRGYATEALLLVVDFAFAKLKLQRLEAGVSEDNSPSQKLFKKVGFEECERANGKLKFMISNSEEKKNASKKPV
ncbi:MAG: GNAT family N-acetyltransferase [Candidatus Margulisbacteria bacterium]|nr:GNAT family N-acetyltransferase [Candidatus Margulisiibacteriota bacterium]